MSSSRRYLGLGLALSLLAGALAGAGAVLAQDPAATPGPSGVTSAAGVPSSGVSVAGPGSGVAGSGIAYPYPIYPGSPGTAPDHTTVVTGMGQADLAADGSGRGGATKTALTAALADAKAQADVIAAAVGVSITGVVSVSASVGDYGPLPLTGAASGGTSGQTVPGPAPLEPVSLPQLSVSVTVVYSIS